MKHKKNIEILKTIGFVLLLILLFGTVLLLMIGSNERWFAYLILAGCVGMLIFLRTTALWKGWRVPLYYILAVVVAWTALFVGLPSTNNQPDFSVNLEQPSAPYNLLIDNVMIIDTRNGDSTPNMSILCIDGKIAEIAPVGTIEVTEDMKVIDATGQYAVPGYNNMHLHVVENKTADDLSSLLLANGITGYRQMDGSPELLADWRNGSFTNSTDKAALLTMPSNLLTPLNAPTPKIARELVRQQKKEGASFIKLGGVTPEVTIAVLLEANEINIPVEGHVLSDMDLKIASEYGFHAVDHFGINNGAIISSSTDEDRLRRETASLPEFLSNPILAQFMKIPVLREFANGIVLDIATDTTVQVENEAVTLRMQNLIDTYNQEKATELAEIFVANGTWQCPTLQRTRLGLISESESTSDELYAVYVKLLQTYDAAGVKMLTGTDGGGGDDWYTAGYSLHDEFDELANAGISPLHVLQMTTLNPAEFLERTHDMGTIEVGKNADIVLLNANPIDSVQNLHDINAVVRAGAYHNRAELDEIIEKYTAVSK